MESFENATIKPTIQIMTSDDYEENQRRVTGAQYVLLMILYYLVFFPVFAICGYGIVRFLRRRGHISQSEAGVMLGDLSSSLPFQNTIPPPPPPPQSLFYFPNSYNGTTKQ